MKYFKMFENSPAIGNSSVQFSSKNDKLDELRDEINSILSGMCDKKIGYNYAVGSKGIFFTTNSGELVSSEGFGCTTYSELLSNLEVILFSVKNINLNSIRSQQDPIEILPIDEPTNDIIQPKQTDEIINELQPIEISIIQDEVEKFESFRNKLF